MGFGFVIDMLIQDQIYQTALKYGIDPSIALSVAARESNFDQSARGSAGEIGIFQLKPTTAQEVGVNPYTVEGNIEGGIAYLKKQFDRFGNWWDALAAYNGGARHVQDGTISTAAKQYASSVLDDAQFVQASPIQGYVYELPESNIGVPMWLGAVVGIGLFAMWKWMR